VLITVEVPEGSIGSLGTGLDVTPSVGEVVGVVEGSIKSVVGVAVAVAVAVSVAEVGAVEESTELVGGLGDTVSVAVAGAAVSVWLAVGETAVSEVAGAVEVSATGAVASVVGAAVSVGLAVGEAVVSEVVGAVEVSDAGAVASVTVAVVVSAAVLRRSLTVPPFQSVAITFVILITQFPTTARRGNNAGRCPLDVGEIP
jgi:hypothetical protein